MCRAHRAGVQGEHCLGDLAALQGRPLPNHALLTGAAAAALHGVHGGLGAAQNCVADMTPCTGVWGDVRLATLQ